MPIDERQLAIGKVLLRRKRMQDIHATISRNTAEIGRMRKENSELAEELCQLVDEDKHDPNGRLVEKWDDADKEEGDRDNG